MCKYQNWQSCFFFCARVYIQTYIKDLKFATGIVPNVLTDMQVPASKFNKAKWNNIVTVDETSAVSQSLQTNDAKC